MRLINQSYEILGTPKSLYEAWGFVAKAARNCYQSQKSKPDETEEQFCRRLLLKHENDLECDHLSPFEFGIIYLKLPGGLFSQIKDYPVRYKNNPYSRCEEVITADSFPMCDYYVTTNLRVILENHWEDDLKYAGPPTEHHVKACCFRMITNRAVMAEITRHRTLSFCIESTRYCNYSKDKFGNELTFISPCWDWEYPKVSKHEETDVIAALQNIEDTYFSLLDYKWSPQQAATILPNALKTTIMMCGYEDSLKHMFRLRAEECSGPVHPQMKELMVPMYEEFKKTQAN